MAEEQTKQDKEIILLKKCIKEKDERITKIENRWDTLLFMSIITGLGISVTAFIWNIGHILFSLPPLIETHINANDKIDKFIVNDWFLLLGFPALVIFAVIGFLAILWILWQKAD